MKQLVILLVFGCSVMNAQVTNVTVNSGQSALSSGLGLTVDLVIDKGVASINFTSTSAQVNLLRKYSSSLLIGPTFGVHHNAPWFAPLFSYTPIKPLSFISWFGVIAGGPNKPDWDINFMFSYHAASFSAANFKLGYSLLHYMMNKPMHLVDLGYTFLLTANDKLSSSVTYDFRNQKPMYMISLNHSFK